MLITIYGINNIGKSTHAKLLTENLNKAGHRAIYLKYPIYDVEPTGPYLNKILRSHQNQQISEEELQIWFALNRYQYEPTLKKLIKEGNIIVAEDYTQTGIAWGSAKGADLKWLQEVNKDLLKEDLAILMTGERSEHSIEPHHIHENNGELIKKVAEQLLTLAQKNTWQIVERQPQKEETQKLIFDIVKKHLSC